MNIKAVIASFVVIISTTFTGVTEAAGTDFNNNGSYLTDNTTHLDWLTLKATYGRTYDEVTESLTQSNSATFGYRVASYEELQTLANNYAGINGVFDGALGNRSGEYPNTSLRELIGFFGNIYSPNDPWGLTNGFLSYSFDGSTHLIETIFSIPNTPGDYIRDKFFPDGDYRDANIGTFLVREANVSAVPEPETVRMLLVGIGLLFVATRKRNS